MPPGNENLLEKFLQARLVLRDVRINLAVGALQVSVAHDGRSAVAGPGHVDHVEVVFFDDAVQVRVDEVLPRRRAPVAEQHVLNVREGERPPEQRVVAEINLADREVVGRAPVGVDFMELFGAEGGRIGFHEIISAGDRGEGFG